MDVTVEDEGSPLSRAARARSRVARREVAAIRLDDTAPAYYVGDEVIVDAEDRDLIEQYLAAGGEIVPDAADPELPPEYRELGLGRDEPLDTSRLPRSLTIRFERLPEPARAELEEVLARADIPADRVRFSSERALALSSLIAPARAEDRGVWLNEVGTDAQVLAHRYPVEAARSDPLTWETMAGPARIAQAWQLLESMRMVRSAEPLVWICVCDSGFWWDASGAPGTPAAAAIADLGSGAPRWNLVSDSSGIPAGPGRKNYHGQSVASAAGAAVGNSLGSAGSGGTVARIAFFHDDRDAKTAKRVMVRCAQWGIPFVVYSGQFVSVEFFFGTSAWNDTFNWAADNGTIMFAAAGNDNRDLPDDAVQRPATRTPRTLTVGATNKDGTKSSFSSWGRSVDVWAPGVAIPVGPTPMLPNGGFVDGTSLAAPLAAGVAAMVRSVNRDLNVDEIRGLLVSSAWNGVGKVTKGLDAYAAVWAAMADRFREDAAEAPPERLFPRADGTFAPIVNDGINRKGDSDEFQLNVATYSTLTLNLQWYGQLASLRIELLNGDPDALTQPTTSVVRTVDSVTLAAQVGTGSYRINVRGDAPTAYLLSGRLTAAVLDSDYLEPNDSFERATRLRVAAETGPVSTPFWAAHGPGEFDLTLHTTGAPSSTTDEDYFRIDVPTDLGALHVPKLTVVSDEPVDVTLYDVAQAEQATWRGVRKKTIEFVPGQRGYVRVAGPRHTRYRLWVGSKLSPTIRRDWEEVHIFPKWWENDVHPAWITGPEEYRGIIIDEFALQDGLVGFGEASSAALPEDFRLELLDDAGELVRRADIVDGVLSFSVEGLETGAYVMHIESGATSDRPIGLMAVAPRSLR